MHAALLIGVGSGQLVTIHRCWASPGVDSFDVATPDARDALIAMGVPAERVCVSGLPLRASFAHGQVRDGGDDHAPRVLLLGGGRPSRPFERAARVLASSGVPMQLVVVCGRNERLRHRLAYALDGWATVLGWCGDIADLIRWSSVVVTKGGPGTVAEALSQARPVIVYHVLEDQETANVALLERSGSGRYLSDIGALPQSIAAGRETVPEGDTAYATWMRQAAQRVAEHILTGPSACSTAICGTLEITEASVGAAPVGTALSGCAGPPRGSRSNTSARCCKPASQEEELKGRVIRNPISGERIVIRESGAETDGRLLSFDLFLPPGGHVPARHVHPNQEERFTVLKGRMRFRLGRRRTVFAEPGDTVVVPPGTAHWFGNAGEEESHARVEVRPAMRLQEVFERSAAMEVVERFLGARTPRLSDLALFMLEFQQELAVPDVPAFLVKTFLTPLAWLGKRRARRAKPGSVR